MTTPELRFPEFSKPWRPAHAGDAFTNSKVKGEAGLPIWSVTLNDGLVPRDSLDRHMEANAADETNLRAQPGDLVYNMMRMWQGAVGQASEECMLSPAYVVLSPKEGTCSKFFDHWFNAPRMLHKLWAFSHGLTKDRLRLYFADFAKIPLSLPDELEQQKISEFLDAVGARIDLLNREKTALEDYKRGATQRLFSGALRFTQDDGTPFPDWEAMRFDAAAERLVIPFDPRKSDELPIVIELENIEAGTGRINGPQILNDQVSMKSSFLAGDVLFGKLRPYLRKFARPDFNGACSTEIWVLRGKKASNQFLFFLIQTEHIIQRAVVSSTGSKMPRADWPVIANTIIPVPHPDEQRKIANFLSVIDAKIDAVSTQISEMESFKMGLLQKMFV